MATIESIVNFILAGLVGVISFFLKRTMGEVDAVKKEIECVKLEYTPRDEFKELDKKMDGMIETVNDVKLNYISKQEFFVAMSRQESLLERMEAKMERYRDEQRNK